MCDGKIVKFPHWVLNFPQCGNYGNLSKSFRKDLEDLIDPKKVHDLMHTYQTPSDVDLYVGGLMETKVPGSVVGPTFHCLNKQQFKNTRMGDRFFYTNKDQFNIWQRNEIRRQSFASVICQNSDSPDELRIPANVFQIPSWENRVKWCWQFPRIDLRLW